jgi:TolB-like protein/Tfp pilus assembly protein PilF
MQKSGGASQSSDRRLGSWKEIAAFFESDESTVRRWEKDRGLPIHRVPGGAGTKVFAYEAELKQWLERPKVEADPAVGGARGAQPSAEPPPAMLGSPSPSIRMAAWNWRHIGLAAFGATLLLSMLAAAAFLRRPDRPSPSPAMRSVAVLPLLNLTGDRTQDYLAAGMTDELTTELARISGLRVVSRTSVQQYANTSKSLPQIARDLDVGAVVEGSVGRYPGGIRVNVQLVDARNDRHIWADTLSRRMDGASSMQHDLAAAIANEIGVELTPFEKQYFAGHHAVTPESFEAYLQGRYYWNKRTPDGLARAETDFKEAIASDPKNPLAYAGLADTYLLDSLYSRTAGEGTLQNAREAASKALALDDRLAEAHCSMAYVLFLQGWDFTGAGKEYRRALALSPNFATAHQWYAELLSVLGRHEQAIEEVRRAEELDPFSMIIHHEAGQILQNAREYPQALEEYRKAEAIDPAFPQPHDNAALAYRRLGEFDLALKELRTAAALNYAFLSPVAGDAMTRAYNASGQRGFLLEYIAQRQLYPDAAYPTALAYAALGDGDRAFVALDQARRKHNLDLLSIEDSPELDGLRGDPRYRDLVKRIGFPDRN